MSYCRSTGVTLIAYNPLGGGLVNLKGKDRRGAMGKVAREAGESEAQVALNRCITEENVIAIPKGCSPVRVEENCHSSAWRLAPEQIRLLESGYRGRICTQEALRRLARRLLPI